MPIVDSGSDDFLRSLRVFDVADGPRFESEFGKSGAGADVKHAAAGEHADEMDLVFFFKRHCSF